jgi:RNA 3'-terminal phosphate cyclase (ATP)
LTLQLSKVRADQLEMPFKKTTNKIGNLNLPEMAEFRPMSDHVYLNGRTLEGGGQLVRIAIALSALTGCPVSVDHVRGNRQGKRGLKRSHAAAVKMLAEISGSKISGSEVGSQFLSFVPQSARSKSGPLVSLSQVTVKSEYNINLTTAGAIFLVFQALYPYLLYVGSQAGTPFLRVKITGGTNASHSPSYDYASQVIVPNFAKLGLPHLSIILHKRGWSSGPIDLGEVTFLIHPLGSEDSVDDRGRNEKPPNVDPCGFPRIDLMAYERGKITQIDITVLAPDEPTLSINGLGTPESTLREFIEQATRQALRRATRELDASTGATSLSSSSDEDPLTRYSAQESPIPVEIHTSQATHHRSHVYILLVAHTSSGFRIGHDALGSLGQGHTKKQRNKGKQNHHTANNDQNIEIDTAFSGATDLVDRCVEGFIEEISNKSPDANADQRLSPEKTSCLDQHMRDQIVVFEALGEACAANGRPEATGTTSREDGRDWSLHTKTAQWVCRQVLGDV